MAKKVHSYNLKGDYYHGKKVIAEYDKKTDSTTYYSLEDILAEFDGRSITVSVKDEDTVPSVEFEDE